jgi:hypothetical protein
VEFEHMFSLYYLAYFVSADDEVALKAKEMQADENIACFYPPLWCRRHKRFFSCVADDADERMRECLVTDKCFFRLVQGILKGDTVPLISCLTV